MAVVTDMQTLSISAEAQKELAQVESLYESICLTDDRSRDHTVWAIRACKGVLLEVKVPSDYPTSPPQPIVHLPHFVPQATVSQFQAALPGLYEPGRLCITAWLELLQKKGRPFSSSCEILPRALADVSVAGNVVVTVAQSEETKPNPAMLLSMTSVLMHLLHNPDRQVVLVTKDTCVGSHAQQCRVLATPVPLSVLECGPSVYNSKLDDWMSRLNSSNVIIGSSEFLSSCFRFNLLSPAKLSLIVFDGMHENMHPQDFLRGIEGPLPHVMVLLSGGHAPPPLLEALQATHVRCAVQSTESQRVTPPSDDPTSTPSPLLDLTPFWPQGNPSVETPAGSATSSSVLKATVPYSNVVVEQSKAADVWRLTVVRVLQSLPPDLVSPKLHKSLFAIGVHFCQEYGLALFVLFVNTGITKLLEEEAAIVAPALANRIRSQLPSLRFSFERLAQQLASMTNAGIPLLQAKMSNLDEILKSISVRLGKAARGIVYVTDPSVAAVVATYLGHAHPSQVSVALTSGASMDSLERETRRAYFEAGQINVLVTDFDPKVLTSTCNFIVVLDGANDQFPSCPNLKELYTFESTHPAKPMTIPTQEIAYPLVHSSTGKLLNLNNATSIFDQYCHAVLGNLFLPRTEFFEYGSSVNGRRELISVSYPSPDGMRSVTKAEVDEIWARIESSGEVAHRQCKSGRRFLFVVVRDMALKGYVTGNNEASQRCIEHSKVACASELRILEKRRESIVASQRDRAALCRDLPLSGSYSSDDSGTPPSSGSQYSMTWETGSDSSYSSHQSGHQSDTSNTDSCGSDGGSREELLGKRDAKSTLQVTMLALFPGGFPHEIIGYHTEERGRQRFQSTVTLIPMQMPFQGKEAYTKKLAEQSAASIACAYLKANPTADDFKGALNRLVSQQFKTTNAVRYSTMEIGRRPIQFQSTVTLLALNNLSFTGTPHNTKRLAEQSAARIAVHKWTHQEIPGVCGNSALSEEDAVID